VKNRRRYAVVAFLAVALLLAWDHWQRHQAEQWAQEAQKQRMLDDLRRRVTAFVAGRDAVTDWQKNLGGAVGGPSLYTADLQPRLVRPDRRPVFFYARVRDIRREADGYAVQFESKPRVLAGVDFDLLCPADLAAEIMKNRSDLLAEYGVIAVIDDVRIEDAQARQETGKVFVARGRCVDLMPTGPDGLSLSLSWALDK